MTKRWFVTAALRPDVALDGPFDSLDACETRCLTRVTELTALRAMVSGRLPGHYLPRQFEMGARAEALPLYRPPVVRAVRGVDGVGEARTGLLPPVVFTYTRSSLLILCQALGLDAPARGADRQAILEHMEAQLRGLDVG